MLKKVVLVSATAALFLVRLAPSPLSAGDSGCSEAAKAHLQTITRATTVQTLVQGPVENLQEVAQLPIERALQTMSAMGQKRK